MAEQSEALRRLRAELEKPLKTINDHLTAASKSLSKQPRPYQLIASAPPKIDPAQSVSLANLSKRKYKRKTPPTVIDGSAPKKKRVPKEKKDASTEVTAKAKAKSKKANFPQLPVELWVKIAEFCGPKQRNKFLLLSRPISMAVSEWLGQVSLHQIIETYPPEMPRKFKNLTDRQYNDLLGSGKGCLAEGCPNKKAQKTYWSFGQRWCSKCWNEKTLKYNDFLKQAKDAGIPNQSHVMLSNCIPHGIQDSYEKSRGTLTGELPGGRTVKLVRVYAKDDAKSIIELFMAMAPPGPYVEDPDSDDATKADAKAAHERLILQKEKARTDHFKELEDQNALHMKTVVTIEKCIEVLQKPTKEANAARRARKMAIYQEKAKVDFPDVPWDRIRKFKSISTAMRNNNESKKDLDFSKNWERMKPKIQKELDNPEASGVSSTLTSRASTPSASPPSPSVIPSASPPSALTRHTPTPPATIPGLSLLALPPSSQSIVSPARTIVSNEVVQSSNNVSSALFVQPAIAPRSAFTNAVSLPSIKFALQTVTDSSTLPPIPMAFQQAFRHPHGHYWSHPFHRSS